jgi:hypothetical protein
MGNGRTLAGVTTQPAYQIGVHRRLNESVPGHRRSIEPPMNADVPGTIQMPTPPTNVPYDIGVVTNPWSSALATLKARRMLRSVTGFNNRESLFIPLIRLNMLPWPTPDEA